MKSKSVAQNGKEHYHTIWPTTKELSSFLNSFREHTPSSLLISLYLIEKFLYPQLEESVKSKTDLVISPWLLV